MTNRFSRALDILLGRDKETPEARAFRHERERTILSLFLYGVAGLCLVLAMILLLTGSIAYVSQVFVSSLLAFAVVGFLTNAVQKWHQNKYGW